jgi:hypothetical protein
MLRSENDARGAEAYGLADVFCQQARLRIEALFAGLWRNTDDADRRLAARTLTGVYDWLEDGVIGRSEGTGPWIAGWEFGPSETDSVARRFLPDTRL